MIEISEEDLDKFRKKDLIFIFENFENLSEILDYLENKNFHYHREYDKNKFILTIKENCISENYRNYYICYNHNHFIYGYGDNCKNYEDKLYFKDLLVKQKIKLKRVDV